MKHRLLYSLLALTVANIKSDVRDRAALFWTLAIVWTTQVRSAPGRGRLMPGR